MPKRSSKPKDMNQLGKSIVDRVAGDQPRAATPGKNPNAVALGRLGGLKGGRARAANLTKKRRSEIARDAAKKRWGKADRKAPPVG